MCTSSDDHWQCVGKSGRIVDGVMAWCLVLYQGGIHVHFIPCYSSLSLPARAINYIRPKHFHTSVLTVVAVAGSYTLAVASPQRVSAGT